MLAGASGNARIGRNDQNGLGCGRRRGILRSARRIKPLPGSKGLAVWARVVVRTSTWLPNRRHQFSTVSTDSSIVRAELSNKRASRGLGTSGEMARVRSRKSRASDLHKSLLISRKTWV